MRFFGDLSVEEIAEVLKISSVTVKRDWRAAKIWLYREMTSGNLDGTGALEIDRPIIIPRCADLQWNKQVRTREIIGPVN